MNVQIPYPLERVLRDRAWTILHSTVTENMLIDLKFSQMMSVDKELCRRILGDLPATAEHNLMHIMIVNREDI
jgi:hypothetical protein